MELGLGQAVGYNAASLKSYVKERLAAAKAAVGLGDLEDDIPAGMDAADALPAELAALVTVGENVQLRTRLSK